MIRYLPLRIAATALTPLLVLHPKPAVCAPAVRAPSVATSIIHMDHISVQVIGKGQAVILIPGLSTPRAVWDGIVPSLATNHRVYLIQVNGFGGEDPGSNLQSGIVDGVVADLHTLIDRNKIAGAAVVGHSIGGFIGLSLAKAHPGDVSRLMTVDSLPYYGAIFSPLATPALLEPRAAEVRDKLAATYGKPADMAMAQVAGERFALKPSSRVKVVAWSADSDPRVSGRAMYEALTTDLRPYLPTIQTPITVVAPWNAELSQAGVDALYHGEYKAAPHVSFIDVPNSGHFVMLDQPEVFATLVGAFANGP